MTRDIMPSVRSWMAETIDTAPGPTRLYEHVASAVRSTPQQRGWLPPIASWRPRADASALAAALVVAAAVVLGTFLFTGVQRGGVAAPGPSSSAIRTAPSFLVPFVYAMPPVSTMRVLETSHPAYLFGLADSVGMVSPEPYTDEPDWYVRGITVAAADDPVVHGCGSYSGRVTIRKTPVELLEDLRVVGGIGVGDAAATLLDGRPAFTAAIDPAASLCEVADIHGHGGSVAGPWTALAMPSRLTAVEVDGVTILVNVWAATEDDLAAWLPLASTFVESIQFQVGPSPSGS